MLRNEKGAALLLISVILTMFIVLGTAFLTLSASDKRISRSQLKQVQALYAADAGIELTMAQIRGSATWLAALTAGTYQLTPATIPRVELNGSVLKEVYLVRETAAVTDPSNVYYVVIKSTGQAGEATRTVETRLKITTSPYMKIGHGVSTSAMAGNKASLNGNTTITADLTFKDSINIQQLTLIGNLRATNVTLDNNANVTGVVYYKTSLNNSSKYVIQTIHDPNLTFTPMDEIQGSWYLDAAIELDSSKVFNTDHTFVPENLTDGLYYVNGNVSITGGQYRAQATIVATGKITIAGDVRAYDRDQDILALTSVIGNPDSTAVDIGGSKILDAIVYTKGTTTIGGNSTVNGALVTESLNTNGKVNIFFDIELASQSPPSFPPQVSVVYWKEAVNII